MRLHPSGPVVPARLLVALSVVLVVLDVSTAAASRTGFRIKRQLPPLEQGNQVIDNIFQIPIGTLNAVGSLIKSARPLVRRTRERIQQYYSGGQQPQSSSSSAVSQQQYYSSGSRPSSVQALMSPFVNRPYYTSYYNNNNINGNRRKQRGEDLPPQGRHRHHGDRDDY